MLGAQYRLLNAQAVEILSMQRDAIVNMANLSAVLFEHLDDINWCGFYRKYGEKLILGPFQGKVACVTIPIGKGVCGKAASCRETVVVPNVHLFEGHIACDSASNSEIVIPLLLGDRLLGVLDVDSAKLNRFGPEERELLEMIASQFVQMCDWPEESN